MRLILFGGSGLLGTELRKIDGSMICPVHNQVDISCYESTEYYINSYKPDIVINSAAVIDNRRIEKEPEQAIRTNIIGSANLSIICRNNNIRYVYISTDYIYRGTHGNYKEDDDIYPFNLYAWTKLGGETSAHAVKNHLIIRTSFGKSKFDYPEAFTDKWASKDYVDILAPMIYEAATGPVTGILNLGTERKTLYNYAKQRNSGVKPVKIEDTHYNTPPDTSLNLQKWINYKSEHSIARPHTKCRVCGSGKLTKYLDLGIMPLANNLEYTAQRARNKERFPLQVMFCEDCGLSQLSLVIDPEKMFSNYTYRSSINAGYVKHCGEMAEDFYKRFNLGTDSFVVDIAGNDGALLREFKDRIGCRVLNVDPASNLVAIAEASGIDSIADFWGFKLSGKILTTHGAADVITATNVFAHVDNVKEFILAAKTLLKRDGVLVLEFPYLVDFIEGNEFDTCFLPGTTILGSNRVIEDCRIGDEVYSADGSRTKVTHVFKTAHDGEILVIKADYLEEIKCTPNHPILITRDNGITKDFIPACEIAVGDLVCVPKLKSPKVDEPVIDLLKYNKVGQHWRRGLKQVRLSEDFAYLAGAYTANGSSGKDAMSIAVDIEKRNSVGERILIGIQSIGSKVRIYDRTKYGSKCHTYNFCCIAIQRLFKEVIGRVAHEKVVPEFIMNGNKAIKESYLRGLFDGDGYYKNGQIHLHTSSKVLALQVQLLFAEFDIMLGLSATPPAEYEIIGIKGISKGSYQLRGKSNAVRLFFNDIPVDSSKKRHSDDEYIYVKVNSINKETYNGYVYNLETESHTYTVSNMAVHNCYFEHCSYFSIRPLKRLCTETNMKIISVEKQNIHGGTVRVIITNDNSRMEVNDNVQQFIDCEEKYSSIEIYRQWGEGIKKVITDFALKIFELKKAGHKIAAFAASAKGNTLLNSAAMNTDVIKFIADETPEKIGRFSPGTAIPIVHKQMIEKDPPDYLIILSWNFKAEIIEKLRPIYKGLYIIPIPETVIEA